MSWRLFARPHGLVRKLCASDGRAHGVTPSLGNAPQALRGASHRPHLLHALLGRRPRVFGISREELFRVSVLCGNDFSKSSAKAAEVAMGIAARLKVP